MKDLILDKVRKCVFQNGSQLPNDGSDHSSGDGGEEIARDLIVYGDPLLIRRSRWVMAWDLT